MPYLGLKEVKIFFDTYGSTGEWVTLINGHTRTSRDFKIMGKKLARLGLRVLTLDNRGSGKTVCDQSFTIEDLAKDVMQLWEHLSIDSSHVLGISMGGFIAQTLSLMAGPVIKSLCLVSTSHQARDLPNNRAWPTDLVGLHEKMRPYFSTDFYKKNEILVNSMLKNMLQEIKDGPFLHDAIMQQNAIKNFSLSPADLNKIKFPTLILHGAEDKLIPSSSAYELHKHIRHSMIEIFAAAGHLLLAERSHDLLLELEKFWLGGP